MANVKFTNFARSKLTVGLSAVDTTIVVTGGTGALFPALSAGQYFYATIENSLLVREIVKVTARTGDTFTVTRGQDNTTAVTWNAADNISLRFTAAAITDTLNSAAQQTSPTGTLILPSGTTAERFDTIGFRYNTTLPRFEGYNGTTWSGIALAGANADITSLTALTAGGLPNDSVLTADIANAQITQAKLATGVAGNGPAFIATVNATQSIPNNSVTRLVFNIESYDTAACYDNATNYRFLPLVAGFYHVTGSFEWSGTSGRVYLVQAHIYKNTSAVLSKSQSITQNTANQHNTEVTGLVYLNGSTDYIEFHAYQFDFTAGAAVTKSAAPVSNYFQAYLARAA